MPRRNYNGAVKSSVPIILLVISVAAGGSLLRAQCFPGRGGSARALQIGDAAPDFSMPGSDGRQYRLADYRGKQAVVLAWFAKAFTGG